MLEEERNRKLREKQQYKEAPGMDKAQLEVSHFIRSELRIRFI